MRQGRIAGIVILCLGAFVLLRGVDFSPRTGPTAESDLQVDSSGPKPIPPWVGGIAMLVGVSLIVVGTRKRT